MREINEKIDDRYLLETRFQRIISLE